MVEVVMVLSVMVEVEIMAEEEMRKLETIEGNNDRSRDGK